MNPETPDKEYQFADVTVRIAFPVEADTDRDERKYEAQRRVERFMEMAKMPEGSWKQFNFRSVPGAMLTLVESEAEYEDRMVGEYEAHIEQQLEDAYARHVDRYGW